MARGHALLLLLLAAAPLAAEEWWLPVAGRATAGDGRRFSTQLHMHNRGGRATQAVLSFFAAQKPGAKPRHALVEIAAGGVAIYEPGQDLVLATEPAGSLRIRSDQPLAVSAHITSTPANGDRANAVAGEIPAIPAWAAIGNGDRTHLPGPLLGGSYRLYGAETNGAPLLFSLRMTDAGGRAPNRRRLYLGAHEQRGWDLDAPFAALNIEGVNGSGKAVFLATETLAGSRDLVIHRMELPLRPRHALSWPEWLLYGLIALALLGAALLRRAR